MLYAKVVVGLDVAGPFDYSVSKDLEDKIKTGCRVKVDFRNKKITGYVVALSHRSNIKKIKPILALIDQSPVLSQSLLRLTRELSDYYVCSWGQSIETALPQALRKGAKVNCSASILTAESPAQEKPALLYDLSGQLRWEHYAEYIKKAKANNKSSIIVFSDIDSAARAKDLLERELSCSIELLYRGQAKEKLIWEKLFNQKVSIVVGTRSAIFSPVANLGLIIIDEEHNTIHKQDQAPHYHAPRIAFMRAKIEKAKLVLASSSPSLETYYLATTNKIEYLPLVARGAQAQVELLNMKNLPALDRKRNIILSGITRERLTETLERKEKILVFINRSGFATYLYCHTCGAFLKCERCNVNLVYHFQEAVLKCHRCNYKIPLPEICPSCNSGYIKYSGMGTEKTESELARIFPQARLKIIEHGQKLDLETSDIFISTEGIIGKAERVFALSVVLSIDDILNRPDLRSSERAWELLCGLRNLTREKMLVQTSLAGHYVFASMEKNEPDLFYKNELKQRRQLGLPPFNHLCLVKVRSLNEAKAEAQAKLLFERLSAENNKNPRIKIVSVSASNPVKLRGNFYWQLFIRGSSAGIITGFLKKHLKNSSHSGIIVTVDMDPL